VWLAPGGAGIWWNVEHLDNYTVPPYATADRRLDISVYSQPSRSPDCGDGIPSHVIVEVCSRSCGLSGTEEARSLA
jgi:hypothetical protein